MIAAMLLISGALAAPCAVFTGGWVHVDGSKITGLEVLVAEGTIQALDGSVERSWAGEPCMMMELPQEFWLTPGLVHVGSTLGLQEIWGEPATHDHDAGGDSVRSAHDVGDSYDPLHVAVDIARREGLTSAVVMPGGGIVAGQAAWVQLLGVTQAQAVQQRGVAMRASLGGGSPAEGLRLLRELLQDARDFAADPQAFDDNRSRTMHAGRMELEALQPVVEGWMPLIIGADRAATIEALIRFADEQRVKLVIDGGAEAWLHAEALAEAEIAVLLNPLNQDPTSWNRIHARHDNADILDEAGVRVLLTNHSALFASHLRQLGGLAVRDGMRHSDVLQALTATPADVFGLEDVGRIEVGGRADLVVWNGDPLELSSWATAVMIEGEWVDKTTRHDWLFDRYRELPGLPLPGLPLPETD